MQLVLLMPQNEVLGRPSEGFGHSHNKKLSSPISFLGSLSLVISISSQGKTGLK